jgi:hypothetical protein
MKTKHLIFNLFFGVMVSTFAIALSVMIAPGDTQAGNPMKQATTVPAAKTDTIAPLVQIDDAKLSDESPATKTDTIEPVEDIIEGLMSKWSLYVMGIVNLLVFLSGAFPKLVLFKDDRKRDLLAKTLAAVIVAGVTVFTVGPKDLWPVLGGFAMAVFNYNNVLKPLVGNTKTVAAKK